MKDHLKAARKPFYPVQFWIKKHGAENIEMVVLEEVPDPSMLNGAEQRWIDALQTFTDVGAGGLNRTRGGDSITGACEDVRERIRAANSGETSWSKLTRVKVDEIRRAYRAGELNQVELAERYEVTLSTINDVIRHRTWADKNYIDDGNRNFRRRIDPASNSNSKLSRDIAASIREDAKTMTNRQIADKYGLSMQHLSAVLQNKKWHDPEYTPLSQSERARARGGPIKATAKLSQAQADEIRDLYATGNYSYRTLGILFGVQLETIGYVIRNQTWVREQ